MARIEVEFECAEHEDLPPATWWVSPSGSLYRLYRIYKVEDSCAAERWVALFVGGTSDGFKNESFDDVRTDWRDAVGNLTPIRGGIKITIKSGPDWEK